MYVREIFIYSSDGLTYIVNCICGYLMLASHEFLLFMYAFWKIILFLTFYIINWQDYGE